MNFRRNLRSDDPEINVVPLIDVLLVVLIFLMVTTTWTKITELQVELPAASTAESAAHSSDINLGVGADSQFRILTATGARVIAHEQLAAELHRVAAAIETPVLVIHADANARHQDVITALAAAREAAIARVTFAARTDTGAEAAPTGSGGRR